MLKSCRRAPTVWTLCQSTDWWDHCVPQFTDTQWIDNFRMSAETFRFLCNRLSPVMKRQDTVFHLFVPFRKQIAIALWKVATISEYCSVAHLFGVGITTGWHSIILQVAVDGRGLFRWKPGSVHDARVHHQPKLWDLLDSGTLFPQHTRTLGGEDVGYFIIGDAAYTSQPWLVKPFADTGRLNDKIISMTKSAGLGLKGRWCCLLKLNDCNVDFVKQMTLACCTLHNLHEQHNEVFRREWNAAPGNEAFQQPAVPLPERMGTNANT
ncbi:unnamed protein product, partial [Coregonus sp. 'balchen']